MWKLVKHFGLQGVIFGLMGVAFLALAVHAALGVADWVRAEHWHATPAVITELRRTTGVRSGYHYYHHYRYVVGGRSYSGEYHRDNVENVRGEMIEVIFNPDEPSESARSRADLARFGRGIFGGLLYYYVAAIGMFMLLSGLVYVRTAYRGVRLQEALAAGERTALQAYFHGTPEEAKRALRDLDAMFARAMQTAKPDTRWYSLLQRGQLRLYARLAKLHRAAGQTKEAENSMREALGCAASAALDRPLQLAREVFEYIDGEDRRILEEQARVSRP
jgi:hypothetical protein